MGRPKGKPNAKPTRADIESYYRVLKAAAAKGQTTAAGQLIQLDMLDRFLAQEERDRLERKTLEAKETGTFTELSDAIRKRIFFEIDQAAGAGKL